MGKKWFVNGGYEMAVERNKMTMCRYITKCIKMTELEHLKFWSQFFVAGT